MSLPKYQFEDNAGNLLVTNWKTVLDPIINQPINSSNILNNIQLISGKNVIDHGLGRNLQGYLIIGQNGLSNIYSLQYLNPLPASNLWLQASSGVPINLLVF